MIIQSCNDTLWPLGVVITSITNLSQPSSLICLRWSSLRYPSVILGTVNRATWWLSDSKSCDQSDQILSVLTWNNREGCYPFFEEGLASLPQFQSPSLGGSHELVVKLAHGPKLTGSTISQRRKRCKVYDWNLTWGKATKRNYRKVCSPHWH